MRLWILVMVLSFTPWLVQAELPLGEVPPLIELSGDKGGRINGESWNSSELRSSLLFQLSPLILPPLSPESSISGGTSPSGSSA